MDYRPTYMPYSGDESYMPSEQDVNMRIIQGNEIKRRSTFADRFNLYTPGLLLRIFALCKFAIILYFATNRPCTDKEVPLVLVMLCINAILLIAATTQDYCTLIISWIITCTLFICYLLLLIIVPIFVTSFFASNAASKSKIPNDWRFFRDIISYKTREEKLFQQGIEYGMSVEIVLVMLVFVAGFQLALLNSTLNTKLDESKRQRQEREKRNSVYLI